MTAEASKEKFLRLFPGGFTDPKYLTDERNYKFAAHGTWCDLLNREEFENLLEAEQFQEICRRALQVESKTSLMLSRFEKSALREAFARETAAPMFAWGLFELIYGEGDFQNRFEEFALDLGTLTSKQTSPYKWTIATIFPFLALPKEHIYLKPEVTKAAAKRRRFSLNYKPELNWLTYSSLLRFAEVLSEEVAELNPRDMIDIQSYIWVTEFYEKGL